MSAGPDFSSSLTGVISSISNLGGGVLAVFAALIPVAIAFKGGPVILAALGRYRATGYYGKYNFKESEYSWMLDEKPGEVSSAERSFVWRDAEAADARDKTYSNLF